MTHSDPLCVFLSVAYCALVAACVGAVPDRARAYERALAHAVAAYPQSVPGSVLALLNDLPRLPYSRLRGSGYSLDTFTAAVWCFLHGETLEQAVVAAVNLGDDADTTGAVAGALAGCYYGFTGLPGRWADTVRHRERLERAVAGLLRVAQS
jgi:ADP-ribosyl-[dinitrogen reductase] hydrolase